MKGEKDSEQPQAVFLEIQYSFPELNYYHKVIDTLQHTDMRGEGGGHSQH